MGVFIDRHTRPARTTPHVRRVVTREKMQRKKIENAIANLPPSRGGACMKRMKVSVSMMVLVLVFSLL